MTRTLKDVVGALADRQQQLFFYERLTNPKLLQELRAIGVFDEPPSVRLEDDKQYFPLWPQARYLINVAAEIPEDVAALISDVHTDNPAVAIDLSQAILKMPAKTAEKLLPQLTSWTGLGGGLILYPLLDIVDLFAQANKTAAALELSAALLDVRPGPQFEIESIGYRSVDAVAKIEDSNYSFALDRVLKALSEAEPKQALELVADLLAKSLTIKYPDRDRDLSSIWLPDLGKDPLGLGTKEQLGHSLFALSLRFLKTGAVPTPYIYGTLASHKEPIFRRMTVALKTETGDAAGAIAELDDPHFYENPELKAERAAMLRKFYPNLTSHEKATALLQIRASIIPASVAREYFGRRLSGAELERAVSDARAEELFQELLPIESYLDGSDADEFCSLKSRFGGEDAPGPKGGGVWVGPTSPKAQDELEAMTTAEILAYAGNWIPKRGFFEHSPEGLGRMLEPVIAARINEFLDAGDAILSLHPIFVRHIVNVLRQHVQEPGFDLVKFVSILEYALLRKVDAATGAFGSLEDPEDSSSWSHLQQTIAFALTDLFRSKRLPAELRERVFQILTSVLEESDPTPEADAKYGADSGYGPPWQLALNSARGAGMLALFDYGRWIYAAQNLKAQGKDLSAAAPELFLALEARLDPGKEPTKAIRSTIGQNFVSTYAMARDWVKRRVDRIFSDDVLGETAWRSYIVFSRAYDELYELLKDHYAGAVAELPGAAPQLERWDASGNLGVHLVTAYLHRLMDLHASALGDYVRQASPDSIGHVLTSLGSALMSEEALPTDGLEKSMALYELVLSTYSAGPHESCYKALSAFGLWVQASQLPASWRLSQLVRTLQCTHGRIVWEARLFDALQGLSPTYPLAAVAALYELTFGTYSTLFMTDTPVRVILENAVRAGGAAQATAIKTNDRLADMGITRYNEMLHSVISERRT